MPKRSEPQWPLGKQAGICIQDDAIPSKLCKSIIKFVKKHPHVQFAGRTVAGEHPETKLSIDAHISGDNPLAQTDEERSFLLDAEHAIYGIYKETLSEYIRSYQSLASEWVARADTGYQYQMYPKGKGMYRSHIDGAPYLRGTGSQRVLASVMYLNTVKKGGGTYFDYFDFTCDAVEGRIVTFPATFLHLHGGLVPESSSKSILSTFVTAPPPPIDTEP